MPDNSLSGRLAESKGEPIEYEGQTVHGIYRWDVHPGDVLRVSFQHATSEVRQGLNVAIKEGQLSVEGQRIKRLVLWADTAPKAVDVVCQPPKSGALLQAWNCWDRYGRMDAWMGNAGMLVERRDGAVVLKCSDGIGSPDFRDLVVELTLVCPHSGH
jgi:hypothetical protein